MTNGLTEAHPFTGAQWTPPICEPGIETRALAQFHRNGTWTGRVEANAMGPGSPEMEARGRATCEWIINGFWLSCMFEQDQFIKGEKVVTWKAHWVTGWDMVAQEYRAVGVDSNGVAFIFRGELKGDALVMESMGDSPVRLRFTWKVVGPDAITWKNEMSIGGGPWRRIEEYIITPSE